MIEITAVGGYSEVGKNMTAVRYNNEAVIIDMGVHLEKYIQFKGDDDLELFNAKELIKAGAIPDDSCIKDIKKKILAIIPSHGHLDHIGAIPYMAQRYDCPIICTPYTASVIKAILKDKEMSIKNDIIVLENGGKKQLSDTMAVEFINITHSIPDAAMVIIHTPEGQIAYTNDFKFDDTPVMGEKPDYERIKKLGEEGHVKILIIDSLYAHLDRKTPSEMAAREMLKKVMLEEDNHDKAMIVTTFSSHIARLKSIVEFGKKLRRKIVFLGRSLSKYVYAAEDIGLVNFSDNVQIVPYKSQISKALKKIELEGREKYLIVATGHQGEPDAVLSRIASGKFKFQLMPEDQIIFSCTVIPSPLNISNREALERKLMQEDVIIYRDIHHSGHASAADHREMIGMLKPENIIPGHVGPEKAGVMAALCEGLGYRLGKNIHIMEDNMKKSF